MLLRCDYISTNDRLQPPGSSPRPTASGWLTLKNGSTPKIVQSHPTKSVWSGAPGVPPTGHDSRRSDNPHHRRQREIEGNCHHAWVATGPRMMLLAVRLKCMSMARSRLPVWSHTLTMSTRYAGSSPNEKVSVPCRLGTESPEGVTDAPILTGKCRPPTVRRRLRRW